MSNILKKLGDLGVVPVVAIERAEDASNLGQALLDGGLPCAEITFRTAAAADAIRALADGYPDMLVGAGTVLTGSTPVYDLVNETVLRGEEDKPLAIPRGAVVVPGCRPAKGSLASREGLQVYTPIIVKYRDPGTDAAVALESALRS